MAARLPLRGVSQRCRALGRCRHGFLGTWGILRRSGVAWRCAHRPIEGREDIPVERRYSCYFFSSEARKWTQIDWKVIKSKTHRIWAKRGRNIMTGNFESLLVKAIKKFSNIQKYHAIFQRKRLIELQVQKSKNLQGHNFATFLHCLKFCKQKQNDVD